MGGLGDGTELSAGYESLNLSFVGRIGNESGDLALEAILGELKNHVKLIPELLLIGLSSLATDFNL